MASSFVMASGDVATTIAADKPPARFQRIIAGIIPNTRSRRGRLTEVHLSEREGGLIHQLPLPVRAYPINDLNQSRLTGLNFGQQASLKLAAFAIFGIHGFFALCLQAIVFFRKRSHLGFAKFHSLVGLQLS